MENKKLTKELLDKVRHIEGFPKGKDEDIIKLSDPPYYTACSNPFIQDFIDAHGTPYDEETDDYHREPFASDVSEGKNDPIYNAHSYHTKVPYKAIMRYILHYTEPGDIVFDGFCGTGMTGVAAQMCENPDPKFGMKIEKEMGKVKWGKRRSILSDLSPVATFIAYNLNTSFEKEEFERECGQILKEIEKECKWMFETNHKLNGKTIKDIWGKPIKGKINYTVWSDLVICPNCNKIIKYWDIAVDPKTGYKIKGNFLICTNCFAKEKKSNFERYKEVRYDESIKKNISVPKEAPILINYSLGKEKYEKVPDQNDLILQKEIDKIEIPYWFPTEVMPEGFNTQQPKVSHGISHVHHFFNKRSLYVSALLWHKIEQISNERFKKILKFWLQSVFVGNTKMNRYFSSSYSQVNRYLKGTLYVAPVRSEVSPWYALKGKIKSLKKLPSYKDDICPLISTQSLNSLQIPENTIDYIFTDPPFGGNLMYSELNFIWESWLKVFTSNKSEAIVNEMQKKELFDYQVLMEECFLKMYRVLKPGRWMTVAFHNSKNSIWNSIQDSLFSAGFMVADVRILDKKQQTMKQYSSANAVDKDLIISVYKPKKYFLKEFVRKAGSEDGIWEFIAQHLEKLPVIVEKDDFINVVAERQDHLLYDRMIAFHIQNGYSVPMGAAEFYGGLKRKFPERDGMYFLPNQVTDYDKKRLQVKGVGQLSLFISDEKSAIQWLRSKLEERTLTYQEIQPDFMREAKFFRHEKGLELQEILEQNFLQDEKGRWYVPDPNKQADLEKLRERALLREFGEYNESRGKLKKFRTEAVRAGFKHCWSNGDYKTIIEIAKRIQDSVLQEDSSLLMYYKNALTREGQK